MRLAARARLIGAMSPSPDDLADLRGALRTRWLGRAHEHHAVLGSTNDRCAAWAREGAPHGALVTADDQTEGRGRRGRRWVAAAGANVCASALLRFATAPRDVGALGLVVGLGLRDGLAAPSSGAAGTGLDASAIVLKWPNDLLVGGRKLGGILCESRSQAGALEVVVGFGLNVHQREFGDLDGLAVSLAGLGLTVSRRQVLASTLRGLEAALDTFVARGFSPLRSRYLAACPWMGGPIDVEDARSPTGRATVVAEALTADGGLVVREPGGSRRTITAGEVWLTR